MNELKGLAEQLRRVMRLRSALLPTGSGGAVDRLKAVSQALSPPRGRFSQARLAQGVMAFRLAGEKTAYPDIKYACYGVARQLDWDGRILLVEARLLDSLLAAVRAQGEGARTTKICKLALRHALQHDVPQLDPIYAGPALSQGVARIEAFLANGR